MTRRRRTEQIMSLAWLISEKYNLFYIIDRNVIEGTRFEEKK